MPEAQPDVSLVIPAYNRADLLACCLESLRGSRGVSCEVIVVDNASPEDLSAVREAYPEVRWLTSTENIGYAAANNLGLRGAAGRYYCHLNSDAELPPESLAAVVRYLDAHPEVGAATPCNVGPEGEIQPSVSPEHGLQMAWLRDSGLHLLFPGAWPFREWLMPRFDFARTQEVPNTQTTCLVIRREAYEAVGEMDPELFLFYNDVDFCRRLRNAGWKLVYLAEATVIHHGSASVETAPWKERQLWRDRYRYFRKWYGWKGTLGTRLACLSRGAARLLAQVAKGRWAALPQIWKLSRSLYASLDQPQNGA